MSEIGQIQQLASCKYTTPDNPTYLRSAPTCVFLYVEMRTTPSVCSRCRGWQLLGCAWLLAIATVTGVSAQRTRIVDATKPIQVLDTLTILSPILTITDAATGAALDLGHFNVKNNLLITDTAALRRTCPTCSQLRVTYRPLAMDLSKPMLRLDTSRIRRAGSTDDIAYDYTPFETAPHTLLAQPGITSNGSYTRGLSVGNSQNLVFNSNLNFQFDGKLGDDLRIRGALTDNSVPLQPDGTTRQLQEFDRIFIELERKNATLAAGDIDFVRPTNGYFTNYFKRIQGAQVRATLGTLKSSTPKPLNNPKPNSNPQPLNPSTQSNPSTLNMGIGVSRGKFNRQIIAGQEGNQGPYRMAGAEGERFIIVLAGTEKVFADGQLLQRGAADDYVIDYNLGEITFTPKRLITKDIRLIVEFEYAVQNFLRSTATAQATWVIPRGKTWLNLYSEQDSRNSSGGQELSLDERARLAQAGDNLRDAFASGIDTLPDFDAGRVLYRWMDTVACNGQPLRILTYSTQTESARLAARFSEVPAGQGNYVQAPGAANGRVFRWVAPDPATCQPRGNFEPIIRLIAPEQRQLHTVGGEYQVTKSTLITAETALSQRDLNRLSPLDQADNIGGAAMIRVRQQVLTPTRNAGWSVLASGQYEHTSRHFKFLNPYRPAEFVRDWNADAGSTIGSQLPPDAAEHLGAARLEWSHNKVNTKGRYEYGGFVRQGLYNGQRHVAQSQIQWRGWEANAEMNLLQTDGLLEKTRFSRPKADVARVFRTLKRQPVLRVGVYLEREKNERRAAGTDTLSRTGLWYDVGRFYATMPDAYRGWRIGASVQQRNDYAPNGRQFGQNTLAREANVNGAWTPAAPPPASRKPVQSLTWNLTWRELQIVNPALTPLDGQQTYLGRVDYNISTLKNGVALTTGYEVGSGQTPKIEFNYLLVNPGEGQYTWVDRNRDSILQVDEMEISVFQDQASYVRVALATTEYQRTDNVNWNQNLRIEPRMWWPQEKGWKGRLARLSLQSTWQINRRVLSGVSGVNAWNPFEVQIADSALVTVNLTARNVLFLNRANPKWDVSIAQNDTRGRVLVTTGFESRRLADWTLHGRLNAGTRWSIENDVARVWRSNDTENFSNRDYALVGWDAGPKVSWLPNRQLRLTAKILGKTRQNTLESAEKSTQLDYQTEFTWNPTAKGDSAGSGGFRAATSLRAKATVADIRYTGAANTPVSFAMLEGLQDGRNLLWSITLDRQLSRSMQLNLTYEGRRTGTGARIVHVGRVQVRAVF
jgi:hypothetical protein